ncbi:hypothetical protein [Parendozoicomonas haliclonae]|nr:hypothetical protein [Parendozoicomonas haliclonae]
MASMNVSPIVIYFRSDQPPRQDVTVSNPDAEVLYLETEIYRVENPGTEQEENVRITTPAEMKLLATPNKAVIPSGNLKSIRLLSLETPSVEKVYRVTFRPVIGDIKANRTAVKILIAYQALVFVQPEKPFWQVSASIQNRQLQLTNTGNINVIIRKPRYCPGTNDNDCIDLEKGRRIYSGQSWSTPLPADIPVDKGTIKYGVYEGNQETTKTLKLG